MKYSNYTKKELLEVIECLEHNYNIQKERADNQFEMLKALQEKLDIAVKALQYYADDLNWSDCTSYGYKQRRYRKIVSLLSFFEKNGYKTAQEALAKIKEIK